MSKNINNVTELSVSTDSKFKRENFTKTIGNWNHFCGEYLDVLIQETSLELAKTKDSAEIDLLSEFDLSRPRDGQLSEIFQTLMGRQGQ